MTASRFREPVAFLLGAAVAFFGILGLAESFLRHTPPEDLRTFLHGTRPVADGYVSHPIYGAGYPGAAALEREYPDAFARFAAERARSPEKPLWALFGNSFVHAPGMLADTLRSRLPDHIVFNFGRNTELPIRFAQIETLLAAGPGFERIVIAFMPIDTLVIGQFPLASVEVAPDGALRYRPRLPDGPPGAIVRDSMVAFTAWVRAGRHRAGHDFSRDRIDHGLSPTLRDDVRTLFGGLAEASRRHGVPVTVVLIPAYDQSLGIHPFGFQDDVISTIGDLRFEIVDPRAAFLDHADPASLYLPDKHLSPAGNALLADSLLAALAAPPEPR